MMTVFKALKSRFGLLLFISIALPIQAQTVMTFSDHQPLGQMRTDFLHEVFFPAIERESKGAIKVEQHWNGERAIAYDALPSLSSGKNDISTIVPEYKASEMPLHQLFKSFPVGPSGAQQVRFFREVFNTIPAFNQELDQNNIHPIFLATGYPAGFFSTQPLADTSAIKAQKWRSASFWHLDFIKSANAVPMRMHWGPEIFDALKDGRMDGILVNIDSAYNLKLHKTAPYALVSPNLWLGHLYIVAMNKDKWLQLSTDEKQAIERAAEFAYAKLGEQMDASYKTMLEKLKQDGAHIKTLTDAQVQNWANATQYQTHQQQWATSSSPEPQKTRQVIEQLTEILVRYQ